MKILVIGENCIDKFIYGTCNRICPEAPVPVFKPMRETVNPGMSANVVNNVLALGSSCDIITNKNIIEKIRYVDSRSNQIIMRLDKNDFVGVEDKYLYVESKLKGYDAIIISDYGKGFLTEKDIELISKVDCVVFLQTNKIIDEWCLEVDFIKINEHEYSHIEYNLKKLEKDGHKINLIVTLGEKGCKYNDMYFKIKNRVEVRDLSGAGDTFLAGLVVKYVKCRDIIQSILYAQECATEVVQKLGVSLVGK